MLGTLPPEDTVQSPGGPGAATDLQARSYCDEEQPGRGLADLLWTPAADRGTEQRVQVTRFAEGFESGNHELSPALTPEVSSFRYENPQGTAKHTWRVLTRHADTWVPSESETFFGPGCIGDEA